MSRVVRAVGLALTCLLLVVAAGCAPARQPDEIVVWTKEAGTDQLEQQRKMLDRFEAEHPGTTVRLVPFFGRGDADATALITAVRGGTGPDVFVADRFTINQFASLGLLQSLQPRVDAEPAGFTDDYLPFALAEATYQQELYGLPWHTDTRGLFYNRQVLRDAGVDLSLLDPANGPMTIEELRAVADQVTTTDEAGSYETMGFVPWSDQAWPFTWGQVLGATYYDQQTCTIAVDDPGFRGIYELYDEWARDLDYARTDAFLASYAPESAPEGTSPLYNGRLAMQINYSGFAFNIEKYAPDLDWGVTYPPVAEEGDDPITWSGGPAFTIPTGAANADGGWELAKFMTSAEGQREWSGSQDNLPTQTAVLDDPEVTEGLEFFAGMLRDGYSSSRPPLPVGSELWETMNTGREAVLVGDSTPDEVMAEIRRRIQPQLDPYCPLTLTPPE
ncbi:ABC transporter substrate-binding protein [Desertihabitans aurantiacus]|uniref:ABC transporter substrate-binding protein n=1 Tax=Desertihabitans aurantiacus TaxID=2282477 RepID=UPI000DF7E154|nr:ABC transporter substrate-binding protein [Desertihabitans aurantiacus]